MAASRRRTAHTNDMEIIEQALQRKILTAESVSQGHPDKLADQVADAILDAHLRQDNRSRVAVEILLTRGLAIVAGEITSLASVDTERVVRETIVRAGYDTGKGLGFDGNAIGVIVAVQKQSSGIAAGVDIGGASDQGIVYGMATSETPEMLPMPIVVAHALTRQAFAVASERPWLKLGPDAKSQVSIQYLNERPEAIETLILSQLHSPDVNVEEARKIIMDYVISPVLKQYSSYCSHTKYLINPVSAFVVGGPLADTGLTGRKLMVDTYGGLSPHGGGAFSGKDPTKIDRSGAYMARHMAKCLVAAGLADRVHVTIAYSFGLPNPVAFSIDTLGTGKIHDRQLEERLRQTFDLTPQGIIDCLNLTTVEYYQTSRNGHFGNDVFPWERVRNLPE